VQAVVRNQTESNVGQSKLAKHVADLFDAGRTRRQVPRPRRVLVLASSAFRHHAPFGRDSRLGTLALKPDRIATVRGS